MCGITGMFGHNNKQFAEVSVKIMNDSIAHRGPDADGIWSNDHCVLGHRRLSIIDTSAAGNQPFISEDKKIVIVFNGEIYNYIELKKELSDFYSFKTSSDTEVILAAYKKWGVQCVSKFFGMFGLAIWDEDLQKLFIIRDRLGIKPIYYAQTEQGFIFASEIRAILKTNLVTKKISSASLADYLRYQTVHAPNTIIEQIKMLMPGHYIQLDKTGISHHAYWDIVDNASKDANYHNATEAKKNILDILTSSVEIRMRADVPFGAFLSGGIDSSVIVGLMSRISSHPVKTFSITFHEKEYDESSYSETIAKKFRTDHTPIKLGAQHFLNLVPEALNAMDHPSGDGPNTYVVSKATREAGVKMALSGLGGDEVFAGYDVFKRIKTLESQKWMNAIPHLLRSFTGNTLRKIKPSVSMEKIALSLASEKIDFHHFYPLTRQVLMDKDVYQLLKSKGDQYNTVSEIALSIQQSKLEIFSKVSVAEMTTYMQNVLLRDTDQMSMAHALEVRVPFLDHRLVEYVLGVTDNIKFPHTAKELLTSSVGDLLPREVIDRPKMGFTFPWALWMKNELHSFCHDNIKSLEQVEGLNFENVLHLWKRFLNGDPLITWSRVWPLVVLGHWVKQHDVH